MQRPGDDHTIATRVDALEREVASLRSELAALRPRDRELDLVARQAALKEPAGNRADHAEWSETARPTRRKSATSFVTGDQLESLVGRYGTLALAGLVILMAVGAVIKMAVEKGLLTPEVRIIGGAIVAALLAAAGLVFRRSGEVRYGGVLLALSLAMIDLLAWGAGPRFHLVPVGAALAVVDIAALMLAILAVHDGSEFLLSVAIAGALSAPFVTFDGGGTPQALLAYGAIVLAGALRSARDPSWMRAFAVLLAGAATYVVTAAVMPMSHAWYGPFAVVLFSTCCAIGALLFGEPEWAGELPRAYLATVFVGALAALDDIGAGSVPVGVGVALLVAVVTYAALAVRDVRTRLWTESALLLPLSSLGIGIAAALGRLGHAAVLGVWTLFALAAWRFERTRDDSRRAGTHFVVSGVLGAVSLGVLLWPYPFQLAAAIAGWAVLLAALGSHDRSSLPTLVISLVLLAASLFAIDQLASRSAYSYVPFWTRSSASALSVTIGIGLAGLVAARSPGRLGTIANRGARLGALIGFLIAWGRMELAQAFNADVASFLLSSYYAACGVGSIVAGRLLAISGLRVAGLVLALYAAFKAVVEVTNISSVALRVAAYAAVGVFLLGAGWLYREQRPERPADMS